MRLSLLVLVLASCLCQAADKRPNIIIFFTDDWGYGDLGVHGKLDDVKTPHLDALAGQGVLFTDAYITAPQCAPSRAGLMTGKYQQRFGFDTIPDGPLPLEEVTMAKRLHDTGYNTGMVGKWHLEPNVLCIEWGKKHCPENIKGNRVFPPVNLSKRYWPQNRGFEHFYYGELKSYWRNYDLQGKPLAPKGERIKDSRFRVDIQTDAALAFIKKHQSDKEKRPFFLYVAHYAPHVPLVATEKYLAKFSGDMPERRRTGLAMMNAVDEGVGKVVKLLKDMKIDDNTLIIFTSDNGAPIGAQQGKPMDDVLPVGKPGPAWDGSRNDPLTGEKGMLSEGGIRVPMIWSWPRKIPKGQKLNNPIISLDMTATVLGLAGIQTIPHELDGKNLAPWLLGQEKTPPKRDLYWRFWNQAAVRSGDWKYLVTGDGREFLFNLSKDLEEKQNIHNKNPEKAAEMRQKLQQWTTELKPIGIPHKGVNDQEKPWFDHYFPNSKRP